MGVSAVTLAIAMNYAQSLSSGIARSSYDPATSTMRVELNDGNSYDVVFDDGVSVEDRKTLDSLRYDVINDKLLFKGKDVLTTSDVETEDIDFTPMF